MLLKIASELVTTEVTGVTGTGIQVVSVHWYNLFRDFPESMHLRLIIESTLLGGNPQTSLSTSVIRLGLEDRANSRIVNQTRPFIVSLHLGTFVGSVKKNEIFWC